MTIYGEGCLTANRKYAPISIKNDLREYSLDFYVFLYGKKQKYLSTEKLKILQWKE